MSFDQDTGIQNGHCNKSDIDSIFDEYIQKEQIGKRLDSVVSQNLVHFVCYPGASRQGVGRGVKGPGSVKIFVSDHLCKSASNDLWSWGHRSMKYLGI